MTICDGYSFAVVAKEARSKAHDLHRRSAWSAAAQATNYVVDRLLRWRHWICDEIQWRQRDGNKNYRINWFDSSWMPNHYSEHILIDRSPGGAIPLATAGRVVYKWNTTHETFLSNNEWLAKHPNRREKPMKSSRTTKNNLQRLLLRTATVTLRKGSFTHCWRWIRAK